SAGPSDRGLKIEQRLIYQALQAKCDLFSSQYKGVVSSIAESSFFYIYQIGNISGKKFKTVDSSRARMYDENT
ncbi:MAG: hypothetical protein PHQ83_10410, partial [Eubacteriales bacterium]|nr:hypothetical protein [Eubacteriales bacterium]